MKTILFLAAFLAYNCCNAQSGTITAIESTYKYLKKGKIPISFSGIDSTIIIHAEVHVIKSRDYCMFWMEDVHLTNKSLPLGLEDVTDTLFFSYKDKKVYHFATQTQMPFEFRKYPLPATGKNQTISRDTVISFGDELTSDILPIPVISGQEKGIKQYFTKSEKFDLIGYRKISINMEAVFRRYQHFTVVNSPAQLGF